MIFSPIWLETLAEAGVLAASWTKPSERPQLALAGRGGLQAPGTKVSAGDSLGWVPAVVTAPPVSHLPCRDPVRCPSSASHRRSPSLGGLPPSPTGTDHCGGQAQPQPCLGALFLLAGCGDPGALPSGRAPSPPDSRAGAPCPLPGHAACPPHDASLTGPFPRSVPRPGLLPAPQKGTHRLAARPVPLEAARGSCPNPGGGARGRGPGPPCRGGRVGSERFASEAFWALPRPVGRL